MKFPKHERRTAKRTSRFVTQRLARRRDWLAVKLRGKSRACPKCKGPTAATHRVELKVKTEQAFVCLICEHKFTKGVKNA